MVNPVSSTTTISYLWQAQNTNQGAGMGYFLIMQLTQNFSKIDTDGDNKISKSELKNFLTQMFKKQSKTGQMPNIDDMVNALFAKLDPTNTGTIDKSTLTTALQKIAKDLFTKIDANGDGKIDKDELSAFLTKMQKHHRHNKTNTTQNVNDVVNKLFSDLDTNNTGYIASSSSIDLLQALMSNQ